MRKHIKITASALSGLAISTLFCVDNASALDFFKKCQGDMCDDNYLSLISIVGTVIEVLSYAVGIVSVLVIVIAGFMYVTANGDANQIARAKTVIQYAIVAIIVALSAFAIVSFVVGRFA